ncbi:hypothetical protein LCGC14_1736890 [marine sediment metagenome]|uniref:Uncharacterized protein n=1 Tax=marine sediment metagenome TaxID=412755 RepID=A0A0F9H7R6_9ZZZZ
MRILKYESRFKAGEILAEFIKSENKTIKEKIKGDSNQFFCFAIPNGGVPITEGFCSQFNLNYNIVIVCDKTMKYLNFKIKKIKKII